MKSSAISHVLCLEGDCLDNNLAKSFIYNKDNFPPKDIAHIKSCDQCQKILEKAREDIAWHGR